MKKLILDPKNVLLSKKNKNFFLNQFFINFIDLNKKKKIRFSILNLKDINVRKQKFHIQYSKKIYKNILREIIPKLNNIHNINWNLKTWDFFLGHWLHAYISIILDRIYLINPIFKKKLNINKQINIGKDASLITNDLRKFTEHSGKIDWNNNLLSRIIYLISTKDFNNHNALLNSVRTYVPAQENFFKSFFFKFKIKFLKVVFFFNKKPFVFYNSYIKDKIKLFKIISKLGTLPIPYSYNFFDTKIVQEKMDLNLRNKILLNHKNEKNLSIKIIKFLFVESFPIIYLEGFRSQKKISDNSHLPKNVKGIFTSSAYTDNSFKFWLADKIQKNNKIFLGTHGVGYNIIKYFYSCEYEAKISKKYFVWGKQKLYPNMVNVGNFLASPIKNKKIIHLDKVLIILPVLDFYKRYMTVFFALSLLRDCREINSILKILNLNKKKIHIKPHPQEFRKEFTILKFINFEENSIKVLNPLDNFQKIVNEYNILIFTYLSTEFMNSLSSNKPCMLLLNKKEFNKYHNNAKNCFLQLHKVGILHFSGISLGRKFNKISKKIYEWWDSPLTSNAKKEFCGNYCGFNFNYKKMLIHLKS